MVRVGGGLKLEINIPLQRIRAEWKGGLINEGGVISSEYGMYRLLQYFLALKTVQRNVTVRVRVR